MQANKLVGPGTAGLPSVDQAPTSKRKKPHAAGPLKLQPTIWEGEVRDPGAQVPAGRTTEAHLFGKRFFRRSQATLQANFQALMARWPSGSSTGPAPSEFQALAQAFDDYKALLLEALGGAKSAASARRLIADVNTLHGKAGHAENVAATALALLGSPEVTARLGLSIKARVQAARLLEAAAPWLNLADLAIPVEILCAPRRLTDLEQAQYIRPRAERSAETLEGLGFAAPEVVALVRQHRGGADRPLLAQLLDLADQAAAMAAKPFFQKDGQVDREKLSASLQNNAEKAGLDAALTEAIVTAIRAGAVDVAQRQPRDRDLWVT